MDDKTRASYEQQSKELRADLKKWESDWADGHNGSKPGRRDIKENPSIGTLLLLADWYCLFDSNHFASCKI